MQTFAVLAAALLAATPALAAPAPAAVVRHADLDLAKAHDASVMLGRINRAASQVCEALQGADAASVLAFEACRREAVARAVDQLAAPQVTAAAGGSLKTRTLARNP